LGELRGLFENELQCYIFALYHTILVPQEIKNLIFDLGGVIINLDVVRTFRAFADLAQCSVEEVKSKVSQHTFFNEYEKGMLDDNEFRYNIRAFLNNKVTDAQIDSAWNAMLLDIPKEKYQLLLKLKSRYRVFLLSNTNNIHLQSVNQIVFSDTGRSGLAHYFHKDYYSHLMKMRKPDSEIFEHVLLENNLVAHETYFLDDNSENIQGAKSVGIQTAHITSPAMVLSLFP
jgi:HAD superfamily hydrolase (TIGR01509 family)